MSLTPNLPSRVGRRSQHNGLVTRVPKPSSERVGRAGTAGRCQNTDNETIRFLADIGPRRINARHRESESIDSQKISANRKRMTQESGRLANLSHDANLRSSSRNWSAAASRRLHRSRATRNAPNLPQINPERRLRNTTATTPTVHLGELCVSRRRTAFCGVCTVTGLKPGNPRWQNQDAYLISENLQSNPNQHCFAVLDGHGEVGHLVSQRCREQLCTHFVDSELNMNRSFRIMQQDLNECSFDVKCSGATCVFAYIHGPHLKVANIGDSRGILGHSHSGDICAIPLTSDHKPDRPDEQRRILACGGQVSCRQLIVGHGSNGPITLPLGPPRVWYRRHQSHGDTMGLAMSRSFGDSIVHGLGVSCEPEITDHRVDSNDIFLICATDGVWDVIDNSQAVQIVHTHFASRPNDWDPSEAAHALCMSARRRWENLSPMIDDITALVIDLQKLVDTARLR